MNDDIGIPKPTGSEKDVELPRLKVLAKNIGITTAVLVIVFGVIIFGAMFAFAPKELLDALGVGKAGKFELAATGAIVWSTIYIIWGLVKPGTQEYMVVERWGKFYKIKHAGIGVLCLRGIIDHVVKEGDLEVHELKMYADEGEDFAIDFKDGSAPIDASIWHRVGHENASWDEVNRAILADAYAYNDPNGRIEEVVDGHARPILQGFDIDEAQEKKDWIAGEVVGNPEVKDAVARTGHFFVKGKKGNGKGLIISDIILPDEIKNLRRQVLEGKKDAERTIAQGKGYANAIAAIMKQLAIPEEEARRIYETQRGLETVEATDANISFVAPSVQGVLVTLGANKADGGES